MAKDEFIGIRVSKELKDRLKKEAKEKGLTLARYLETYVKGDFLESKYITESLISDSKEKRPEYWDEARKSGLIKDLEWYIPVLVSDFVSPKGHVSGLPLHMSYLIGDLYKAVVNNMDSVDEFHKGDVSLYALRVGRMLADNLNKLKSQEREFQKKIIREIKAIAETFIFYLASMAFEKDSFFKLKKELDRIEKSLIDEIDKDLENNKSGIKKL